MYLIPRESKLIGGECRDQKIVLCDISYVVLEHHVHRARDR